MHVYLKDLAKDLHHQQEWALSEMAEGDADSSVLEQMAAAGAALLASVLVEQGVVEDLLGKHLLNNLEEFCDGRTKKPLEECLGVPTQKPDLIPDPDPVPDMDLSCDKCEFVGKTFPGLLTHKTRKHK